MNSINTFFRRLKERPSIYIVLLVLVTGFSALEAYNPIIKKYGSFSYIIEENYIDRLAKWIIKAGEFLADGDKAFYFILFTLLSLLLLSAISALFFSGYMNVLLCSVEDKPKSKGEYAKGIGKNFLKTLAYIYVAFILSTIFFFMVLYSVLPVLLRVRQLVDGNAGVIFSALILGLLTLIVVVLALIFYVLYFSYVLPAIAGMKKGAVWAGIRMTNTYIWYLMPKTVLFMLGDAIIRSLLFLIHYGHQSTAMSIVILCFTAMLRSILYFVYIYFTFNTFIAMREDLYPEYSEDISEKKEVTKTPVKDSEVKISEVKVEKKEETNEIIKSEAQYTRAHTTSRRSRVVSRPLEEEKQKFVFSEVSSDDDEYDDSFDV